MPRNGRAFIKVIPRHRPAHAPAALEVGAVLQVADLLRMAVIATFAA